MSVPQSLEDYEHRFLCRFGPAQTVLQNPTYKQHHTTLETNAKIKERRDRKRLRANLRSLNLQEHC